MRARGKNHLPSGDSGLLGLRMHFEVRAHLGGAGSNLQKVTKL